MINKFWPVANHTYVWIGLYFRSGLALAIIGSTGLLFGSIIIFIYGADREVVSGTFYMV